MRQEISAEERVVRFTPAFAAVVPYAPRVPLETWILPRQHGCSFEEAVRAETGGGPARRPSPSFPARARGFGGPGVEMVLPPAPHLRLPILPGGMAATRGAYHPPIHNLPPP